MFKKSKVSLAMTVASLGIAATAHADTNYPTQMNSAYAYDVSYDCSTGKGILPTYLNRELNTDGATLVTQYGHCAETWDTTTPANIIAFNKNIVPTADPNYALTGLNQIYAYGADVEVYHDASKPLSDKANMGAEASLTTTNYPNPVPDTMHDPITDKDGNVYSGENSLKNYINQLGALGADNKVHNLNIIVDGRHDNLGVFAGFLGQYQNEFGGNDTSINNWTNTPSTDYPDGYATDIAKQILVDGYTDPNTGQKYDGICNSLSTLQSYADTTYPNAGIKLGGIQFDLEPFHLPDNTTGAIVCDGSANAPADCGQYYFYKAVKNIFETNPACSALKPYFSTFIMAGALLNSKGEVSPEAADLFANSPDSYAAISLYDLGAAGQTDHITKYPVGVGPNNLYSEMANAGMNTARAGFVASEPDYYNSAVGAEIAKMKAIDDAGIHYQFGIPLVASAHEFDGFKIQAPTNNDVYFATPDSATPGSYKPDMADSDDTMYDTNAAPANDSTQALYVKDVLEQIEAYYLNQNPKNYMGLTLWAFQPENGNHWSPRNMVTTDMAGNAIPNEYYLWNPYPKTGDPAYAGYVNLDVYMRLFTPNGICTSNSGCPVDEQNVWTDGVQSAIQNEQFNLFQFGYVTPTINWAQGDVEAPAQYNPDGSFQVILKPATLLPNPHNLPISYYTAIYASDKTEIAGCGVAPDTTTGDYIATCQVDGKHLGQPVQFAATAAVDGHTEIAPQSLSATINVASISWPAGSVVAPASYGADGSFQVTLKPAILTPNPNNLPISYYTAIYASDKTEIAGCAVAPDTTSDNYIASCKVDSSHLGQQVQFAATAAVDTHPEIASQNLGASVAASTN